MYPNADVEKTMNVPPEHIRRAMDRERAEQDSPRECGGTQAARPMTSEEIVAEFFKYHPPNDFTIPKFAAINQAAKNFAEVLLANVPSGWDRRDAINCIRQARMIANAAVALNGLSL
jgi:hypothetical protein